MVEQPAGGMALLAAALDSRPDAPAGSARAGLSAPEPDLWVALREVARRRGGQVVRSSDGGLWATFARPADAAAAAAHIVAAARDARWGDIRVGLHAVVGAVGSRDDGGKADADAAHAYLRQVLRVCPPGQILASATFAALLGGAGASGLYLRPVGRLDRRDNSAPAVVYRVEAAGEPSPAVGRPSGSGQMGGGNPPGDPASVAPGRRARPAPPRQRAGSAPQPFRIRTLGQFAVERGGELVDLAAAPGLNKGLQLFKCLLARPGRRLPRDQAYELFWPDSPRGAVLTTFRTAVKRVRDLLEPDVDARDSVLQHTPEVVSLRAEPPVWVDADEFERLLSEARHAADPLPLLEEADRLYAGDFLPDDLYHDWAAPRRAELKRLWVTLQLELAGRREGRGEIQAAEAALQCLLDADPSDERAARELMLLQARHGRRAEALKIYQRLEEALQRDVQVAPAAETQAVRQRIAAGEAGPMSGPVQAAGSPTPSQAAADRLTAGPQTPPAPPSPAAVAPAVPPPSASGPRSPAGAAPTPPRGELPMQGKPPTPGGPTSWPVLPDPSSYAPTYPFPTPGALLGRDDALAVSRQTLQAGLAEGQTLLIGAPAGAGKSALAGLIVAEARAMGYVCLAGGSFDRETPAPYAPIRDALCDYLLAQSPEHLHAELGHLATDLAPIVPELRYHLGEAFLEAASATSEPSRLLAAVHGCMRVLAMRTPTLLCLEDLHAADGATLEVLQYLARQTRRLRLVLIGTFRPEDVQAGRPLDRLLSGLRRNGSAQELRLPPLSRPDTRTLIATRLKGAASEALADALFGVTEGNPLFTEQLALALREEERIEERGGVWYVAAGARGQLPALPPVVESVIERRFDRVPPGGRETLAMAAVLGPAFDLPTLLAALAPEDGAQVIATLDDAIAAQLVRETASGYRFAHAMIREALYHRLSGPRRATLHARAGAAIEAAAGARADERAAELAHHFTEAASVAPTAEKALRFGVVAGRRAAGLSAHREALRHFTRAHDLLTLRRRQGSSPDLAIEIDVLQGRGMAEHDLGLWQDAIRTFRQVLDLTDDPYHRSRAYGAIGRGLEQVVDMESALAAYDDAMAALAPVADEPQAASMLLALRYDQAFPYLVQGRFADALAAGRHILDAGERTDDPLLRFRGNCMMALAQMWSGQSSAATVQYERALAAVQLGGNKLQIATAHENFGTQLYLAGRFAEARTHIQQAAAFYRDAAGERRTVLACQRMSRILLAEGDLEPAYEWAERGRVLALEVGDRHAAECNAALGAVLAAQGRLPDAISCYERALDVQQRVGHRVSTIDSLLGLGLLHERLGIPDRAEALYREAADIAEQMDPGIRTVASLRQLGRFLVSRGRPDEGSPLVERAVALAEGMDATLELAPALLARAELLAAADRGAALADLERAAASPMAADVASEVSALRVALNGETSPPNPLRGAGEARWNHVPPSPRRR